MWWWRRCWRRIFLNTNISSHTSRSILQSFTEIENIFHANPGVIQHFGKKNGFCCNLDHHEPKSGQLIPSENWKTIESISDIWFMMYKIATKSILLFKLFPYIWSGMKNILNFCNGLKMDQLIRLLLYMLRRILLKHLHHHHILQKIPNLWKPCFC